MTPDTGACAPSGDDRLRERVASALARYLPAAAGIPERPSALAVGTMQPTGRVVRDQGGYVCVGRWTLACGADGAEWFLVTARLTGPAGLDVPAPDGRPRIVHVLLRRSEVARVRPAAQSPAAVVVRPVFVPAARTLSEARLASPARR